MQTWKHFQANKQSERIDKSLENTAEEIKEIERVIWIGLLCTQEPVFRRPTMTGSFKCLNKRILHCRLHLKTTMQGVSLTSPSRSQSIQKGSQNFR